MAETKAAKRKPSSKRAKPKSRPGAGSSRSGTRSATKGSSAKASTNGSKSSAARTSRRKPQANGKVASAADSVRETVGDVGQKAGNGAGQIAKKGAIPLAAGSAALLAAAGGMAYGAKHSGGTILGVKLPQARRLKIRSRDLATAAKEVGRFGESVGDLTSELRDTRRALASGNGGNSPIELLLKGLTARVER